MDTTTTRRTIPGAFAADVVTGALPPTAAAPTGVSPELLALIAAAREASRASDDYHHQVYEPADARRNQAVAGAKASLPHTTVDAGENILGERLVWTTANPTSVAMARFCANAAKADSNRPATQVAAARKLLAAHLWRERAIRRAQRTGGIGLIIKHSNALSDLSAVAENAVGSFCARTPADLALKLAFMVERDMGNGMDWLSELLTDAQRITGDIA